MEDVKPDQTIPAQPKKKSGFRKFLRWFVFILLLAGAIALWWKYYFVFGEGVKSGELNYVVKKGYVFKTWEGKMIQRGTKEMMVSNEFIFSIKSDSIAHILEQNSGKCFDLHYREYLGVIPWRGNTKFIVDRVDKIKELVDCGVR
ncbi:MAG: hypothetical protein JNM14_06625 [Ferruginibacter sp.]|nr:hypothetical protein [Ferruginibacter sp.]